MRSDQAIALIRAHYNRDDAWFRTLVVQLCSSKGGERVKAEVFHLTQAMTMMELPPDARRFLSELRPASGELFFDEKVSRVLDAIVAEFEAKDALRMRGIEPRRRVLMHGPPGNGKSSAAAALAKRVGLPGWSMSLTNILGSHMGATGQNIQKAFSALKHEVLLVVDELESVGGTRGDMSSAAGIESTRAVNSLLTLMDEHPCGVLVATTNRVELLDPAVRRRFDVEIEVASPDNETRQRVINACCQRYSIDVVSIPLYAGVIDESLDSITKRVLAAARADVLSAAAAKAVANA